MTNRDNKVTNTSAGYEVTFAFDGSPPDMELVESMMHAAGPMIAERVRQV
jgi:hypothetical protein